MAATSRTAFRLDPDLIRQIDERAKAEGVTRTAFVENAVRKALTSDARITTSRPAPRGEKRHAVTCKCGVCVPQKV
jgi:metal-responsive CopG/Arc/MetJ family transcriptional regulator